MLRKETREYILDREPIKTKRCHHLSTEALKCQANRLASQNSISASIQSSHYKSAGCSTPHLNLLGPGHVGLHNYYSTIHTVQDFRFKSHTVKKKHFGYAANTISTLNLNNFLPFLKDFCSS